MKKIIGIVGGVGPYAGLDLNKKVFDNMKTNGLDQDYLDVFLLSRSSDIEDRTKFLKGLTKKHPAYGIFRTILKLESIGANVVAIPCNTAHSPIIYEKVKELLKISNSEVELLHIVHETYLFLEKYYSNIQNIGLLGTLGTYETKLYEDYFNKQKLFTLLNPSKINKEKSHNAIYNLEYGVKAYSNPVKEKAIKDFTEVMDELIHNGAQALILGCTEIPLAFQDKKEYKGIPLVDPTDVLARALIKNIDEKYLKEYKE